MPSRPTRTVRCVFRLALALSLAVFSGGCAMSSARMANFQGTRHFKSGNYTAARQEFHRAALDDPGNTDYAHNLAMAMQRQGDAQGAELTLRKALTANPSHQPSYHALASLMRDQGRTQEAQNLLEGWAVTQPQSPNSHLEMAWWKRENGDIAGAEQSLKQALQAQPNHPTALAHLGQVYQDSGRNTEAVAMYQRSLASSYNQPQVHSRLAAMRPAWTYRANERVAAGQSVTLAPSMAAGGPAYAPMMSTPMMSNVMTPGPMMAQQPLGLGSFPMAYGDPSAVVSSPATAYQFPLQPTFAWPDAARSAGLEPPAPNPAPLIGNADPAHVPTGAPASANAGPPAVQPY